MKIMKFGGTSVGKPERMHAVAELITAETEPVLVILSALSGTTNSLVEISQSLLSGHKEQAMAKLRKLRAHYDDFSEAIVSTHQARDEAADWLRDLLDSGPMRLRDIEQAATDEGIARRTLFRAKKDVGIVAERDESARGRPATWRLDLSCQTFSAAPLGRHDGTKSNGVSSPTHTFSANNSLPRENVGTEPVPTSNIVRLER